jgi:CBS domain-containing protein
MNVEAILRAKGRHVATVRTDAPVATVVRDLANKGIGALVVSDDGRTVDGIISERDIVQALAAHGANILGMKVGDLMTRKVITCTPEDQVADLMARMTERRFRHLPVMQDGRLSGIVSIGDLVKNRIDEVEYEATELRNFIVG